MFHSTHSSKNKKQKKSLWLNPRQLRRSHQTPPATRSHPRSHVVRREDPSLLKQKTKTTRPTQQIRGSSTQIRLHPEKSKDFQQTQETFILDIVRRTKKWAAFLGISQLFAAIVQGEVQWYTTIFF